MADTKAEQTQGRRQSGQGLSRREREPQGMRWREPGYGSLGSPFELMDRMSEEMDRWWDRMFGGTGMPRRSRSGFLGSSGTQGLWAPRIEAFQKEDRFIVRAELPGLKKDDIQVELTDDAITIHGERTEEQQEEREGYYHSERQYGQFRRTIPLPEGVITESANASFRDGVLEVTMQAPPSEASRGRRLEIRDASGERQT